MRKLLLTMIIISFLAITVSAAEFTAPTVPESAEKYFPEETETFWQGLWQLIKAATEKIQPSITEAAGVCLSIIAIILLTSILQSFSGTAKRTLQIVGALVIGTLLIRPSNSLVQLGAQTVTELSEYGKLLTPVMTAALAAQGGTTTSAALYAGTVFFNTFLTTGIANLIVPLIYIYIAVCVAGCATGEAVLQNICRFIKWLITWSLKITIYLFTGYIGITGVVSGATDAAALKAAKLTISGFVPVVGNIISDASEAILVSAGVMKSAAGIYGLLALIAILIEPFLQIGIQYLLLKLTAAVCSVFDTGGGLSLVRDFSGVMGLLLAMTGTVCLILLISTVCFMKGIA